MEWVDLECPGRGAALGRRASKKPHAAWPKRSEGNWDVRIDTGGTVAAIASNRSSRSLFGFVSENRLAWLTLLGLAIGWLVRGYLLGCR